MIRRAVLVALVVLAALPTLAGALTVNDVARELRCPTCNTTLDISTAPVALRMKAFIAERIEAGWDKERIIEALEADFGPSVRATPGTEGFDLLAWLVPGLAVMAGLVAIPLVARSWRRRAPAPAAPAAPISDDDRRRLDEELGPPG